MPVGEEVEVEIRAHIVKKKSKRKGPQAKWVASEEKVTADRSATRACPPMHQMTTACLSASCLQGVFETFIIPLSLRDHIENNTTAEGILALASEMHGLTASRCELQCFGEALRPMEILRPLCIRPSLFEKGNLIQLYLKPTEEEEYLEEHAKGTPDVEDTAPSTEASLGGFLDGIESIAWRDKLVAGETGSPEGDPIEPETMEPDTGQLSSLTSLSSLTPRDQPPNKKQPPKPEEVIKKIFHPSLVPKKKEKVNYDDVDVSSLVPPISVSEFVLDGPLSTLKRPSRSALYEGTDEEGIEVVVKEIQDPAKYHNHRDHSQALKRLRRERELIESKGGINTEGEQAELPSPCTEAHLHVAKDRGYFGEKSATYPPAEEERRRRARFLVEEEGFEGDSGGGPSLLSKRKGSTVLRLGSRATRQQKSSYWLSSQLFRP